MKNQHKAILNTALTVWGIIVTRYWKYAFGIIVLFTILSIYGITTKLTPDFSNIAFFPKKSTFAQDLKSINDNYANAYPIFVLIEGEDKKTIINTIDTLSSQLEKNPYVSYIIDNKDNLILKNKLLLLSEAKRFSLINDLFTSLSLKQFIDAINNQLLELEDGLVSDKEMIVHLRALKNIFKGLTDDEKTSYIVKQFNTLLIGENYFIDSTEKHGLLMIVPNFNTGDSDILLKGIGDIENEINNLELTNVNIGLTGIHVRTRDEILAGTKDINLSLIMSFSLIFLFLILFLRMRSAPILLIVTLFLGLLWGMGTVSFIWGKINLIESISFIFLLGISIDFSIHLLTGFLQEKKKYRYAIRSTFLKTGNAVLGGFFTTIGVFLIFYFSKSETLRKLGLVSAIATFSQFAAMFLCLPISLKIKEYFSKKNVYSTHSFPQFTEKMNHIYISISKKRAFFVIFFSIIIIGVSAFWAFKVKRLQNPMELYSDKMQSIFLQKKLSALFDISPDVLVVEENSIESLREVHHAINQLPTVKNVNSIIPLLPTLENQEKRIKRINKMQKRINQDNNIIYSKQQLYASIDKLHNNILDFRDFMELSGKSQKILFYIENILELNKKDNIFEQLKFKISKNNAYIQGKFQASAKKFLSKIDDKEIITIETLPTFIKENLISKNGDRFLLTVFPTQDPWPEIFRKNFIESVLKISEKTTGYVLLGDKLVDIVKYDAIRLTLIAFIFVFILLLFLIKKIKMVLITIVPLMCTMICLIAIMSITNIKFDFINVIILPIIIAIGTDYGLHISHRYLYEGEQNLNRTIIIVGQAIFFSSATSLIGFASIIPSNLHSIAQIGYLMVVAIVLCYLFTMILQTTLIRIFCSK